MGKLRLQKGQSLAQGAIVNVPCDSTLNLSCTLQNVSASRPSLGAGCWESSLKESRAQDEQVSLPVCANHLGAPIAAKGQRRSLHSRHIKTPFPRSRDEHRPPGVALSSPPNYSALFGDHLSPLSCHLGERYLHGDAALQDGHSEMGPGVGTRSQEERTGQQPHQPGGLGKGDVAPRHPPLRDRSGVGSG